MTTEMNAILDYIASGLRRALDEGAERTEIIGNVLAYVERCSEEPDLDDGAMPCPACGGNPEAPCPECDPTRAPCPTCDGEGGWLREPRTDEERAQGVETVHDECPDCYGHGTLDARALATMVRELRGALADESQDLADRAAALEYAEGEAWRPGLVKLCHELGVAIYEDAAQGIRDALAFWKREAAEHIAVADQHAAEIAEWQDAAGLIPGDETARDPGDLTPAMLHAWMERHDRDAELTEAIRTAGRALAEIAEADIQACGHRDPGAEVCDESCPCCGPAQAALKAWARANWRWHRREDG